MLIRWLSQQIQSAFEALRQLRRAPLVTLMTAAVIGITLALPAALCITLDNVAVLSDSLKQSATLTLYLKQNLGQHETQQLAHMLQNRPDVLAVQTISPGAGLRQLEQQTGMTPSAGALPDNPLPWVMVITPAGTDTPGKTLAELKTTLENRPETDTVQVDTQWVAQLEAILKTTHQVALSLTALLAMAVLFIAGNTIGTVIRRHHRDIQIIQLTGGTARFIRRPFLYAGAFYGLLGAGVASCLIALLLYSFTEPVHQLAVLYHSAFTLTGLSVTDTVYLFGGGLFLGLLGAYIAVTRYLYLSRY